MYTTLKERVRIAVINYPHLIIDSKDLGEVEGFPLADFEKAGMSKSDLKKLNGVGLVMIGRLPTKRGHVNRYALLARG